MNYSEETFISDFPTEEFNPQFYLTLHKSI